MGRKRLLGGAAALVAVALIGTLAYVHFASAPAPVAQKTSLATARASASAPPPTQATAPGQTTATPKPVPSESQLASTSLRNATTVAAPGASTGTMSIPRLGIHNAPIYDRGLDSKGYMQIAPGYAVTRYRYSASIGAGNAVLYGHDDIQGNIFGHLYDLATGDTIEINIAGGTQIYRVTGHQIVSPTTLSVLAPTGDVRLTVITCWPFGVDTKRWIVTAVPA